MSFFLIVCTVAVLLIFYIIGVYNKLVRYRNQVKNAWGQIDVQLQRRYDLIPNLVESVKGYMAHEKDTLTAVIEARNQAAHARESIHSEGAPSGGAIQALVGAEKLLSSGLGNIFALAENYPQLRASENMTKLQEELATTENKVAFSRQSYNDQVLLYNTFQQQFPAVLLATPFGHQAADLYKVEDTKARQGVKVKF